MFFFGWMKDGPALLKMWVGAIIQSVHSAEQKHSLCIMLSPPQTAVSKHQGNVIVERDVYMAKQRLLMPLAPTPFKHPLDRQGLERVHQAVGNARPSRPWVQVGALLTGPHVPGKIES